MEAELYFIIVWDTIIYHRSWPSLQLQLIERQLSNFTIKMTNKILLAHFVLSFRSTCVIP